jgi:hypothetical protein
MEVMPLKTFHRCVARYDGDFSVKRIKEIPPLPPPPETE